MSAITFLLATFVVSVQSEIDCPTTPLNRGIRNYIEARHNELRSLIPRGAWAYGTRGKNIYALKYNCTLEAQAQVIANQCSGGSSGGLPAGTSENVYSLSGAGLSAGIFAVATTRWWQQSVLNQLLRYNVRYTAAAQAGGLAGYAQVVWGATTLVGCGFQQCSGLGTVICHCMIGRTLDQDVYEIGQGCTGPSQCTTFPGSTCMTSLQLCEKPLIVDPIPPGSQPGVSTTTAATSVETCTGSPLIDTVRNIIVNRHNVLRSKIAKGQSVGNGFTKGCKSMFAVKYDCLLEKGAQNMASRCNDTNTFKPERGRNVYLVEISKNPGLAMIDAISEWQKEIDNFDVNSVLSVGGAKNDVAEVGQFAQMAFWRTTAVGCGISICNSTNKAVVCRYKLARSDTAKAYPGSTTSTGCVQSTCAKVNSSAVCNSMSGLCELP